MKSKGLVILILGLWIFQCFFGKIILEFQRRECRYQFETALNQAKIKNTTQLFISKNTKINWTKPSKEFLYKGKMFDVVSLSKSKNGLNIVCYHDKAEDIVNIKANKLKQEEQNQQTDKQQNLKYLQHSTSDKVINPMLLSFHLTIKNHKTEAGFYANPFSPPENS